MSVGWWAAEQGIEGTDGIEEDPVEECEWGGRGGHLSRGQGFEQSWWGDILFRRCGGQSGIVSVSGTERGPRALTRKGPRWGKGRFPGTPALREAEEWTVGKPPMCRQRPLHNKRPEAGCRKGHGLFSLKPFSSPCTKPKAIPAAFFLCAANKTDKNCDLWTLLW